MGQAKKRGTFEQRKALAVEKRVQEQVARLNLEQEQADRLHALMTKHKVRIVDGAISPATSALRRARLMATSALAHIEKG